MTTESAAPPQQHAFVFTMDALGISTYLPPRIGGLLRRLRNQNHDVFLAYDPAKKGMRTAQYAREQNAVDGLIALPKQPGEALQSKIATLSRKQLLWIDDNADRLSAVSEWGVKTLHTTLSPNRHVGKGNEAIVDKDKDRKFNEFVDTIDRYISPEPVEEAEPIVEESQPVHEAVEENTISEIVPEVLSENDPAPEKKAQTSKLILIDISFNTPLHADRIRKETQQIVADAQEKGALVAFTASSKDKTANPIQDAVPSDYFFHRAYTTLDDNLLERVQQETGITPQNTLCIVSRNVSQAERKLKQNGYEVCCTALPWGMAVTEVIPTNRSAKGKDYLRIKSSIDAFVQG